MISVAVGEMGCSLQEAFDMSWAEFQIRLIALKRTQQREAALYREIAYQVYCLGFLFSKHKPKQKEVFWPIYRNVKRVSEDIKNAFLERFKKMQGGGT